VGGGGMMLLACPCGHSVDIHSPEKTYNTWVVCDSPTLTIV
jgi:hypothetical protein